MTWVDTHMYNCTSSRYPTKCICTNTAKIKQTRLALCLSDVLCSSSSSLFTLICIYSKIFEVIAIKRNKKKGSEIDLKLHS